LMILYFFNSGSGHNITTPLRISMTCFPVN
jgi:hypothetical protein